MNCLVTSIDIKCDMMNLWLFKRACLLSLRKHNTILIDIRPPIFMITLSITTIIDDLDLYPAECESAHWLHMSDEFVTNIKA